MKSLAVVLLVLAFPIALSAQQMPDPKQISGLPLPVADVPAGTVTVRVIRGQLTNVLPGQTVELTGAGQPKTATTDDAGRAQFSGLTPGTRIKASVVVNGERIESREFELPAATGVRLLLVATDPDTEKRAQQDRQLAQQAPVNGVVVLGEQSRMVIEPGDEALNVFNILQIVNTARTPVRTAAPLVFDLPEGATGAGVLEGSAPNAVVAGGHLTVNGPFPPGNTTVQFAYSLGFGSGTMTIRQRMPVSLMQVSLIVQKIGALQMTSPQIARQRDMSAEGQNYIVAQGPAVAAGDELAITLTGLPHHPVWPRNLSLALASIVLVAGVWGAARRRPEQAVRQNTLRARREHLFGDLAALEEQRRGGRIDEGKYAARHTRLVTALEGVYAELDQEAAR